MTPENAIVTLRQQALAAKRVAALRERRAALGLKRLELYVHPDDASAIKAVAAALNAKRSIPTKA